MSVKISFSFWLEKEIRFDSKQENRSQWEGEEEERTLVLSNAADGG